MPNCSICVHALRHEIDVSIVGGASERSVAKQFGVSASAVHRHISGGHVQEVLRAAKKAEVVQEGLDLQRIISENIEDLRSLSQEARAHGSYTAAVQALGHIFRAAEILKKTDGDKPPDAPKESGFFKNYMKRAEEVYEGSKS